MAGAGMVQMQIYASEDLKRRLTKEFGEGRVSANVEKILRFYLEHPEEEKKMRLKEINESIRRFNADFQTNAEIIFPEPPPSPQVADLTDNLEEASAIGTFSE